jgi:flavin-dependent dehydrogenase
LVGDAAGVSDPFSGEGIYAAIKSGIMASEEVRRAFASGSFALDNYSRRIHASFTEDYRYAWMLSNVFYRAPRFFFSVFANSVALQTAASEMGELHFSYKKSFYRGLKSPLRLYNLFRKGFAAASL